MNDYFALWDDDRHEWWGGSLHRNRYFNREKVWIARDNLAAMGYHIAVMRLHPDLPDVTDTRPVTTTRTEKP